MSRLRPGFGLPRRSVIVAAAACVWLVHTSATPLNHDEPAVSQSAGASAAPVLAPTPHPPVPLTLGAMWLAPERLDGRPPDMYANFLRGIRLLEESNDPAAALPLVSASPLARTPVADYASYYTGLALQRLNRLDQAEATFAALAASDPSGHLSEDALLKLGEVREARGNSAGALQAYEALLGRDHLSMPQLAWLRLAGAAEATGATERATEAYRHVYREFPTSPEAAQAESALTRLDAWDLSTPERIDAELARAQTLFRARRWPAARSAYERLQDVTRGAQRELVDIRLAAIDVLAGTARQARAAREKLRRLARADEPRAEEARFYLLGATRAAGQRDEFERLTRQYVDDYPESPFAEEALNNLATAKIIADEDDEAEAIFLEMLRRFPSGRYSERAAWRAGWWAYRADRYRQAIALFEQGAASSPRSDYRPAWLYWSGRAYEALGDIPPAVARYRLTATDYLNSYYGRLAIARLEARKEPLPPASVKRVAVTGDTPSEPPTSDRITLLISLGMWREAMNELLYAQRVWGDSPRLQATVALVQNRLGNLRAGINAMKRAYPQYMAAGGEDLPREILEVLFPVDYWPLLQRHAKAHELDPYLLAALVAQESTFDPAIRSSANAIGLMQILPSTGRQYARRLGISRFSSSRLTNPEINVRIGASYFARLVEEFGGAHFALASYNAGESRVRTWKAERPDIEQDEFIDDIPFPETQNYVKRILGTAEDYRRLYAGVSTESMMRPSPDGSPRAPAKKVTKAPAKRAPVRKSPPARKPRKRPAR